VNFFAYHDCANRKGRLPEEAELNYALNKGKIEAAKNFEITQSDVNYAGTTGGQFNLRILGVEELKIVKPSKEDINGSFRRRCLVPLIFNFDKNIYILTKDIHPRTGRGDSWQELPILLKKDSRVSLFYRDEKWSLVDLDADGPDSGGWVPSTMLHL